jgi:hypothetical protein
LRCTNHASRKSSRFDFLSREIFKRLARTFRLNLIVLTCTHTHTTHPPKQTHKHIISSTTREILKSRAIGSSPNSTSISRSRGTPFSVHHR